MHLPLFLMIFISEHTVSFKVNKNKSHIKPFPPQKQGQRNRVGECTADWPDCGRVGKSREKDGLYITEDGWVSDHFQMSGSLKGHVDYSFVLLISPQFTAVQASAIDRPVAIFHNNGWSSAWYAVVSVQIGFRCIDTGAGNTVHLETKLINILRADSWKQDNQCVQDRVAFQISRLWKQKPSLSQGKSFKTWWVSEHFHQLKNEDRSEAFSLAAVFQWNAIFEHS